MVVRFDNFQKVVKSKRWMLRDVALDRASRSVLFPASVPLAKQKRDASW